LKQLAIKRLFKFPPHLTSVSALPGEIRTSEIWVKMNKKHTHINTVHLSGSVTPPASQLQCLQ